MLLCITVIVVLYRNKPLSEKCFIGKKKINRAKRQYPWGDRRTERNDNNNNKNIQTNLVGEKRISMELF